MKFATITIFATLLAVPTAIAQQTQTDCTVNANSASCTSDTSPSFQQNMDTFSKNMESIGKNVAGRVAQPLVVFA